MAAGYAGNETVTVPADRMIFDVAAGVPGVVLVLAPGVSWLTLDGEGDVQVLGNSTANNIRGNLGTDYLDGGGGNDTLIARNSSTLLHGGAGNDLLEDGTATYFDAPGGVRVDLREYYAQDTISAGLDTVHTQNLVGSAFDDRLTGNSSGNVLEGGTGNDRLDGYLGDDTLLGGAGDDILTGGKGADVLIGGDGSDTVSYEARTSLMDYSQGKAGSYVVVDLGAGTSGQDAAGDSYSSIENIIGTFWFGDFLTGNDQDNILDGLGGTDTLHGAGGNDTLYVGGTDLVYGDEGVDTASYASVGWGLTVDLRLAGLSQLDGSKLFGIENLTGTTFDDTLIGDAGANVLDGGAGADTLNGFVGDDTLRGGAGNDIFVVTQSGGNDIVADFQNGSDKFNVGYLTSSFSGVTVTASGSDAVLSFGGGSPTVRVLNTSVGAIDASDFVFSVAAVISGSLTGTVTEDGHAPYENWRPENIGNLNAVGLDGPLDFVAQTGVTTNHGSFAIDETGAWIYRLDDSNAEVQALNVDGTLHDLVTVETVDGTQQVLDVTIRGNNDWAVITGTTSGSVTEASGVNNAIPGTPTATGTLSATDIDSAATFVAQAGLAKSYGSFSIDAVGAWSYTLNNSNAAVQELNSGGTLHDLVTVATADGTQRVIDITINGVSDSGPIAGSVSISDVTVTEGNGGTQLATFTVTRTGGTAAFNVNYATADGTATVADSDYAAASGTLQFGAGINSMIFSVVVNGDTRFEPDEAFSANLSGATNGATISDSAGVGAILNNDAAPITIESFGVTKLVQLGNQFSLQDSGGAGPTLKYQGAAVIAGQFGAAWAAIGAEHVGSGYQIAFKNGTADQYAVWNVDGNGNMLDLPAGILSGSSSTLQLLETTFQQDLNGNGQIGLVPVTIESFGVTKLVQLGSQFSLQDSGGAGPALKYQGAAVIAGQFGAAWTAIGAEQVGSGYQIAFKNGTADQYAVWNVDGNGNMLDLPAGILSGSSSTLQLLETTFQQDLNGNGQIGLVPITLESFGVTKLVQLGSQFSLQDSGGSGPTLKYQGAAVIAGQFGAAWAAIGAEQVGSGYQIAFKNGTADQYAVWNVDGNGNMLDVPAGILSGASSTLQLLETTFQQDLNGNGQIGLVPTTIEAVGVTNLVQLGNQFSLQDSGGVGPTLKYQGAAVVDGQFGMAWKAIGAEHDGSGYDVVFKNGTADQYAVWNVDGNGNMLDAPAGILSGSSSTLQLLETTFQQDLNGNGQIGLVPTTIEAFGVTKLVQVGSQFFLQDSGGVGPTMKYQGGAFVDGQFGAWKAIGAEQTASGYMAAFKNGAADQYVIWNLDGGGNYIGNATGVVAGSDPGLRALELAFHQDLNGNGQIGSASSLAVEQVVSGPADFSATSAYETTLLAETSGTLTLLLATYRHEL